MSAPAVVQAPVFGFDHSSHYHCHTLVVAFAYGVLSADPWHKRYQLPPNFEKVVNVVAAAVFERWPTEEVVVIAPNDFAEFCRDTLKENEDFLRWNDWPGHPADSITFVDRYTPTPEARDFIDLDAVFQNVAVYLRDQARLSADFDARFEADHPELKNQDPRGAE